MNQIINKPEEISVEVFATPDQMLYDRRNGNYGLVFGLVKDVANQYGIRYTYKDKRLICAAPKSRLQKFIEKLHFAMIKFTEV